MKTPLLCCLLLTASCQFIKNPIPKHYPDETGLVGVTVPDGSMTGTWAVVIEWATVVTVPLLGDRNGGSLGLRLLTRTWDPGPRKYTDQFKWCSNDVYEVEGTKSDVPREAIAKLRLVTFETDVDHEAGRYQTSLIVNTWGVQNLPDAVNTDLPTSDNYQSQPNSDYVLDEDEDGHPGFTATLTGTISGTAYVLSRNIYTMDGAVLSVDHIQGQARSQRSEQHTVEGSNRFVVGESKVRADPDPTQSWFDMLRIPEGSTCADVFAAYNENRLPHSRPFPK